MARPKKDLTDANDTSEIRAMKEELNSLLEKSRVIAAKIERLESRIHVARLEQIVQRVDPSALQSLSPIKRRKKPVQPDGEEPVQDPAEDARQAIDEEPEIDAVSLAERKEPLRGHDYEIFDSAPERKSQADAVGLKPLRMANRGWVRVACDPVTIGNARRMSFNPCKGDIEFDDLSHELREKIAYVFKAPPF